MKILTADDSVMIRRVVRSAVEMIGYECLEARDGQEALDILENEHQQVALVLLDWNMPNVDGLQVLQRIKEDERFKSIPVTMVTTEIERARVVQAIAAGAKNYLMKPFSHEDLVTKILQSLGQGF